MKLSLMAALLATAVPRNIVPAVPEVSVQDVQGGYEISLPRFDARVGSAVERQVNDLAIAKCGTKQVEWGRFQSRESLGKKPGVDPVMVENYRKAFTCLASAPTTYPAAPSDWQASAKDEADAKQAFADYFGKRDAGQFDSAYAYLEPEAATDPNAWHAQMQAFNSKAGKGTRRITGVTWYVNPTQASHPGVFAAIDYVADFPSMQFYCGFVGFYRRGPGDYRIVHEEQSIAAKADGHLEDAQLARMKAAYCRGG